MLRGVNVGGKNKLPMKNLAALFEELGFDAVKTFIQSGNVIYRDASQDPTAAAGKIANEIERRFGLRVPVIIRSREEMRKVVESNPLLVAESGSDQDLHVAFLADEPASAQIASLDPQRSPPDRFELKGREIYLLLPNGVAQSKLTNAYFDSKLKTVSTVRNWRTVTSLLEAMG